MRVNLNIETHSSAADHKICRWDWSGNRNAEKIR